ncbi:MAG TPA: CAP domain-containing protein [Burkholderiaceae bacterium]|nr:CAP domain-containing protein [Burkholderiaceae bacterium]
MSNFAAEALQRVNQYRAQGASCGSYGSFGPAPALAWNNALIASSTRHSTDMATNNFFSHTGSDGSDPGQRMLAAGYNWSTWGENIAAGYPSVASVVDAWMASPGHCANIMNANFKDIGLACVKGGSYGMYWTMDLGKLP